MVYGDKSIELKKITSNSTSNESSLVYSHIRLWGVQAVEESLWGHPFDEEPSLADPPVVVHAVDVPRQAEVSDLHDAFLANEHAPRGQIEVDALGRKG